MKLATSITQRIISTFIVNAMAIITGSAMFGVDITKGALIAGFSAVAQVVERLARASVDGKLTMSEVNDAFAPIAPKESK